MLLIFGYFCIVFAALYDIFVMIVRRYYDAGSFLFLYTRSMVYRYYPCKNENDIKAIRFHFDQWNAKMLKFL